MKNSFAPFGGEIRFLNETIETATHKRFNLGNKKLVKAAIQFIGLPHFGARLRVFHLNKLLNELPKSQKILDAGCGIGLNSFLLGRKSFRVLGVDNDVQKIALAKKMSERSGYNNVSFRVLDITKNDLPSNSFDSVLCFEVLEHIKEDEKAIHNISRVLKQNGILLLSVPGKGIISKINKESKHHFREGYRFDELKQKLSHNNLVIKKVIKIEHTPLGFLIRYINDEVGRRSLLLVTLLFPIFLPLAVLDSYLPEMITPNNWIIVAQKKPQS